MFSNCLVSGKPLIDVFKLSCIGQTFNSGSSGLGFAEIIALYNGGKWYGTFFGKFPENLVLVTFPKCEPFKQKIAEGKAIGTRNSR